MIPFVKFDTVSSGFDGINRILFSDLLLFSAHKAKKHKMSDDSRRSKSVKKMAVEYSSRKVPSLAEFAVPTGTAKKLQSAVSRPTEYEFPQLSETSSDFRDGSDDDALVVNPSAEDLNSIRIRDVGTDHDEDVSRDRNRPVNTAPNTYSEYDGAVGGTSTINMKHFTGSKAEYSVSENKNKCVPSSTVVSIANEVSHGGISTGAISRDSRPRVNSRGMSRKLASRLSPPRVVVDKSLADNPNLFDYIQDPSTFVTDERAMVWNDCGATHDRRIFRI